MDVIKRVNGLTLEETIKKFKPYIKAAANRGLTNSVCSFEDLVQECNIAIIKAFNGDYDNYECFDAKVVSSINYAVLQYSCSNYSCLSGGGWIRSEYGFKISDDEMRAMGAREETIDGRRRLRNTFYAQNIDDLYSLCDYGQMDEIERIEFFDWRKYLTPEEKFVIGHHFGFDCDEPMTLTEIAEQMGSYRDKMRRILHSGLSKLKQCDGISGYEYKAVEKTKNSNSKRNRRNRKVSDDVNFDNLDKFIPDYNRDDWKDKLEKCSWAKSTRELMNEKGLSYKDVYSKLGYNRNTFSHWMVAQSVPNYKTALSVLNFVANF